MRICQVCAFGVQKRASGPPGDGVTDGCEPQDMGAGNDVGSSVRVAGALNCLAITPASWIMNFYDCFFIYSILHKKSISNEPKEKNKPI